MKSLSIAIVLFLLGMPRAFATETCTFTGESDYSGHLQGKTIVTSDGPTTTVRVILKTHASFLFVPIDYLLDEISTWKNGELQKVGRNERYLVFGGIKRQIWDVYKRNGSRLEGYRVQGKTLESLKSLYPGFVSYWPVSTFGEAWMKDYDQAPPQRRADLDLGPELTTPDIKTPLAMAFYWIRFLKPEAQPLTIFVPGEERYKRIDLKLDAPRTAEDGTLLWRVPFRAGPLKTPDNDPATFWVTPDHKLVRADLDIDHTLGSAKGSMQLQGCQTDPVSESLTE